MPPELFNTAIIKTAVCYHGNRTALLTPISYHGDVMSKIRVCIIGGCFDVGG